MERIDGRMPQHDIARFRAADDVTVLGRIGKSEAVRKEARLDALQPDGVMLQDRFESRDERRGGERLVRVSPVLFALQALPVLQMFGVEHARPRPS